MFNFREFAARDFFKSVVLVFAVAATAQAGILDGLDAYWPMNGNLEDVAGDLGSAANDVGGRQSNHVTTAIQAGNVGRYEEAISTPRAR